MEKTQERTAQAVRTHAGRNQSKHTATAAAVIVKMGKDERGACYTLHRTDHREIKTANISGLYIEMERSDPTRRTGKKYIIEINKANRSEHTAKLYRMDRRIPDGKQYRQFIGEYDIGYWHGMIGSLRLSIDARRIN